MASCSNRFSLLEEEQISAIEGKSKNLNTTRSTNTWVNVFNSWAESRNVIPELSLFAPEDLNAILRRFYAEAKKVDGNDYEPDSLRVMQSGLHRYLLDCKYPKSIITDPEFKTSRDVLEGKARILREKGMGKRPNAACALTKEQEEMLWEKRKLGAISPEVLLHTIWFNNIQHFGQRGRQEHVSMNVNNFNRRTTDDGRQCIEFLEDPTKCRGKGLHPNFRVTPPKMVATGCERCPVKLFDLYMSKRPEHMKTSGRFYLNPKNNTTLANDVCYMVTGVGKNKICSIMKLIVKDTPLEHCGLKFTNHSGRKTVIKKLKHAKVPESSIIKLTGHTTEKGLRNYDPGDDGEFTSMSHAITGTAVNSLKKIASTDSDSSRSIDFVKSANMNMNGASSSFISNSRGASSSVSSVSNSSGGIPAVIHYNNCKIYNIQTLNQTYSNKNNKRKFIIYDSSDDSQEI